MAERRFFIFKIETAYTCIFWTRFQINSLKSYIFHLKHDEGFAFSDVCNKLMKHSSDWNGRINNNCSLTYFSSITDILYVTSHLKVRRHSYHKTYRSEGTKEGSLTLKKLKISALGDGGWGQMLHIQTFIFISIYKFVDTYVQKHLLKEFAMCMCLYLCYQKTIWLPGTLDITHCQHWHQSNWER